MDINAFFKISYGLYIVSSKSNNGKMTGHISNSVFQVTAEPPKFAICTNKNNLTTDYIMQTNAFSVSVIKEDVDLNFIGHFGFKSGSNFNKFENMSHIFCSTGSPIVTENAVAYLDCKVVNSLDVGSHILFIAEIADAQVLLNDTPALTYNYYRNVIKGNSPKNAPTFIDKSNLVQSTKEEKSYKCAVCGYVYNPHIGDPESDVQAGVQFIDLPNDWICPVCGVSKDNFEEL